MGSFFKDIAGGLSNAEQSMLGPTYNYAKQIKGPSELDPPLSGKGTMPALAADIAGIINYTQVLVSGDSKAQRNGGSRPLGNRFYLKTGGQCTSSDGQLHDRYIFTNNVPTGSIPFISSASGARLPAFRGLVPGTIENLGHLNPLALFGGFMQGTNPKCRKLDLKADYPINGKTSGFYVADADIANLDGCLWAGNGTSGTNPVSRKEATGCKAGFKNMNDIMAGIKDSFGNDLTLKNNPVANAYNLGFSVLILYLLYQFTIKKGD
jgi:hypothetical protein